MIETFSINPEQGEQRRSRSRTQSINNNLPVRCANLPLYVRVVSTLEQLDHGHTGQREKVDWKSAFDTRHLLFSYVLTLWLGCNIHAAVYNKIMVVD